MSLAYNMSSVVLKMQKAEAEHCLVGFSKKNATKIVPISPRPPPPHMCTVASSCTQKKKFQEKEHIFVLFQVFFLPRHEIFFFFENNGVFGLLIMFAYFFCYIFLQCHICLKKFLWHLRHVKVPNYFAIRFCGTLGPTWFWFNCLKQIKFIWTREFYPPTQKKKNKNQVFFGGGGGGGRFSGSKIVNFLVWAR